MTQPIVLITRSRVKEERAEEFDTFFRERSPVVDFGESDTVAQLSFLSEDGRELHIVHVFPHADALDVHLDGAAEAVDRAGRYLDSLAWEIYGAPNPGTLQQVQAWALQSGVRLSVFPDNFGGYLRASLD